MRHLMFFIICSALTEVGMSEPIQVVRLGVVPQHTAKEIVASWSGLAKVLEKELDVKVILETAKSIPEFERRLASGWYDLAYMNPYHYVVFSGRVGYRAILKACKGSLRGIVVVRPENGAVNLSSLKGETIAFPAPAAFAASILVQNELASKRIHYKKKYVNSHDSVYLDVLSGRSAAGGGVAGTLKNFERKSGKKLKVLWKSVQFAPHPLAIHPRLGNRFSESVRRVLVRERLSNVDGKYFNSGNWCFSMPNDWDPVKLLGIKEL